MHLLASQRIVLASGSPRRKQILENIGLKFEVIPSGYEENLDKSLFKHPHEYVLETAKHKTLEVAERLKNDKKAPDLVIGADTVVTMDGKIFEKPKDEDDAFQMLSGFSGRCHTVITGVILVSPKKGQGFDIKSFHEATEVEFDEVTPEVVRAYIATGEPMDKAGGYGIQAVGGTLVKGIKGDYFNVMGFPLHHFAKRLLEKCQNDSS